MLHGSLISLYTTETLYTTRDRLSADWDARNIKTYPPPRPRRLPDLSNANPGEKKIIELISYMQD